MRSGVATRQLFENQAPFCNVFGFELLADLCSRVKPEGGYSMGNIGTSGDSNIPTSFESGNKPSSGSYEKVHDLLHYWYGYS